MNENKHLLRVVRFRSGFTLIEILVTIAIIAVLAALLFPAIRPIIDKAGKLDSISKMRSIHAALQMYAADNNNKYPDVWNKNDPGAALYPDATWDVCLMPYLENFADTMHVRRDSKIIRESGQPRSFALTPTVVNLWGMMGPGGAWGNFGATQPADVGINLSTIKRPSKFCILFEAFHTRNILGSVGVSVTGEPANDPDPAKDLRKIGFYFLLADGHVEWYPPPYNQDAFSQDYFHAD